MKWLIGEMLHNSKDPKIGVTGVVDESCRSRHEFSVNLIRDMEPFISSIRVGEFVQGKQVNVLLLSRFCFITAILGFVGSKQFSIVAINEVAFFDILFCFDT